MDICIVGDRIDRERLAELAAARFGDLLKGVVDVRREVMALGAELHADEESLLLQQGSRQEDLWGINLYPAETGEAFLEFDSMINLRPGQGNRSRGVDDPALRQRIREIVERLTA